MTTKEEKRYDITQHMPILIEKCNEAGYILGRITIKAVTGVSDYEARILALMLEEDPRLQHLQKKYISQGLSNDIPDEKLIKTVESRGFKISKEIKEGQKHTIDLNVFRGTETKFGLVSDTHLGSKFQQLTYLKAAYLKFEEEGIKHVLHAGDLIEGEGMYPGQAYELFMHGARDQINYAIDIYPHKPEMTTYIIAGNHDESFMKRMGLDAVEMIAKERGDIYYLGHYLAEIIFNDIKVQIMHPDKGVPYARSYHVQRIIEQMSPEHKPHAIFFGHWHVTAGLESYRNVFARSLPCFQSQTKYLKRKGLHPELGFYIVTVKTNNRDIEHGTVTWNAQYFPFYVPKENDF